MGEFLFGEESVVCDADKHAGGGEKGGFGEKELVAGVYMIKCPS